MHDLTGGFTPDQLRRYSRHILLPDVGGRGQSRLFAATVALDPRGPAARVAAAYLAAAGVGTLLLTGPDRPLAAPDLLFPLTSADLAHSLHTALAARLTALNAQLLLEKINPGEGNANRGGELANAGGAKINPGGGLSGFRTLEVDEVGVSGLAEAMVRGGEAAARLVWEMAVGR